MALSRPVLWTARSQSGRERQNPLRCKAFATDYRQAPGGIGGALEHWRSEQKQDEMSLTI